jgi:hypothetical protein
MAITPVRKVLRIGKSMLWFGTENLIENGLHYKTLEEWLL